MTENAVAIIGMACRFPGGESLQDYWQSLCSGQNQVRPIPPERMQVEPETPALAGLLESPLAFDAGFFQITEGEARAMDPQQRLMLELSHEALRDAGLSRKQLEGSATGVFMGVSSQDYAHTQLLSPAQANMYTITGSAASVIANRLSYTYDWQGPSLVVDTACSSSLTAVHLALESLYSGASELALAGGVNLLFSELIHQGFAEALALSPEGRCAAFDAQANGIARGEGAGLVILKPLAAAQAAGDRIYAVIRGSALSQDGLTNGLSAPSPAGQRRTLETAIRAAALDPAQIQYIETHGTGTPLGDPIEAKALGQVYAQKRAKAGLPPLKIGSVKTQIGHLEAAAGIASLIKVCLMLYHRQWVPSLHFHTPNPKIPFQDWHLSVQTEPEVLPTAGEPIYAAVSAFGFGGTNAHLILEARDQCPHPEADQAGLLWLHAHSPSSLRAQAQRLAKHLEAETAPQLRNLCLSSARLLSSEKWHAPLAFEQREDLISELKKLAENGEVYKTLPPAQRQLVLLFSGMGSQEEGMGRQLLAESVFLERFKAIDTCLQPWAGFSVLEALQHGHDGSPQQIQPLLFAIQLSLVSLLESWGLRPSALIGTSMGEITAACAGGWISLEDACRLVALRIQLICRTLGQGGMAVVGLSEVELQPWLKDRKVWLAGLNGPELCVVSGESQALAQLISDLQAAGQFARNVLGAEAPSHSPLMEPLEADFYAALQDLTPLKGQIPVYSTVEPHPEPHLNFELPYWWQNLRQPVSLLPVIQSLLEKGPCVLLEISPHPVLIGSLLALNETAPHPLFGLPSLRRDQKNSQSLRQSLGILACLGFSLKGQTPIENLPLSFPAYAWDHQNYLLASPEGQRPSPLSLRAQASGQARSGPHKAPALKDLAEIPEAERATFLVRALQAELAQALRLEAAQLDPHLPLQHLGIGSLVGMELYSRLKKTFAIQLPLSEFLKGPSIQQIADLILKNLKTPSQETPLERPEQLPLSFTQQRFWLLEQLYPGQKTHFIPIAVSLQGPLDLKILKAAFEAIVKRHEILRTLYLQDNQGTPYQKILPSAVLDWQVFEAPPSESALQEAIKSFARQPFDWTQAPPLRIGVFRLSEHEHRLVLGLHHILADGLSFRILFAELREFYLAASENRVPELEALKWQYADFALWQRKNPAPETDLNYWKNTLRQAPAQIRLPWDGARQEVPQGKQAPFEISAPLRLALENHAKAAGVSLFAVLLASFAHLLWRLSGETDLVIGTPIAGRLESETQPLIGPFLNMLPLRQEIDPQEGWLSWLNRVQTRLYEALDHQALPFEQMVESLQPPRLPGVHPLFQTVLALHGEIGFEALGETQLTGLELDIGVTRFDLALTLIPEGDLLKGLVEFDTQLFSEASIAAWTKAWLHTLAALPDLPPETPLQDLCKADLPYTVHGPQIAWPENRLLPLLAKASDQIALRDLRKLSQPEDWSYARLWQEAQQLAGALLEQGPTEAPVAIWLENSPQAVVSWLGSLLADRPYLPLDPDSPRDRILSLLETLDQPLLLSTASRLAELGYAGPCLAFEEIPPQAGMLPTAHTNLACLILTSGSSGTPKAVQVTQAGLSNLVQWHLKTFPTAPGELIPQIANLSFDAAGWEIWTTLAAGATLVFLPTPLRLDPTALQKFMLENAVRQVFLPTPLAEALIRLNWPETSCFSVLRTGGDRLGPLPAQPLPFALWNQYGPTECSVVASAGCVSAQPGQKPDLGQLLPNFKAWVLDAQGNSLPEGFPGELALAGIGLAAGYWQAPELSESKFKSLPEPHYLTGDRVRFLAGRLHFLGRTDRQFKRRGVRIEAAEIEAQLLHFPGVEQACVLWQQEELIACIQGLKPEALKDCENWLKRKLPSALQPDRWLARDTFPLSSRGKLDLQALAEQIQPTLAVKTQTLQGLSGEILEMAKLWQKFLPTAQLQAETSFFEAGGHSLLALRLIQAVREQMGREISLQLLFEAPSLQEFTQAVLQAPQLSFAWPQIQPDPAHHSAPYAMTPVQEAYWLGRQQSLTLGGISTQALWVLSLPELEPERLEKALNRLIQRHPMLHTVVTEEGRLQTLAGLPHFTLQQTDLRNLSEAERKQQLENLREEMLALRLDPQSWPLFSLRLLRLPEGWQLYLLLDALIADASSFLNLGKELERFYRTPELELPALELQFRDYRLALENLKGSPPWQAAHDYWNKRLKTLPEAPQWPLRLAPEKIQTPRFQRLSFELKCPAWEQLKTGAQAYQLTPNGLVLSLFAACIAAYSATEGFLLNLTTFQRLPLHAQVQDLMGDFTHLTLLAIPPRSESLGAWAQTIQTQLWQDLEHALLDGVEVLRAARAQGRPLNAPVVFTGLLGQKTPPLPLNAELILAQTQTPQVWLDCQASESETGLSLHWDYLSELFPAGLIEQAFAAFTGLVARLSEAPEIWQRPVNTALLGPTLISPERIRANATEREIVPQTLHQAFFAKAQSQPEALALISPERRLSYAELAARALALAQELRQFPLQPGQPIAILMHKGWEQAVAALAILLVGGAYLPIDASLPPERIQALLKLGEVRWGIAQAALEPAFAEVTWLKVSDQAPEDFNWAQSFAQEWPPGDPHSMAYLLFTSGSTGEPKGVMLSHAAAWNTLVAVSDMIQLKAEDRVFGISSLGFDLSVYDLFGTWAAGACLVLPAAESQREPDRWLPLLEEVTVWNSVPALMGLLLEYIKRLPEFHWPALRKVLLSGDWIPLELPEQIRATAPQAQIWSLGGATEAAIWSIAYPIETRLPEWNSVPYGYPLANQRFEVMNSAFEPCPDWVSGEIWIAGEGLALGYWRDPLKTQQRFVTDAQGQRWYRTGDLGRYRPQGLLEFLGRQDFQVKIQGYRIELGEIEACLRLHPRVKDVLVHAPGERHQRRLVACLIAEATPTELSAWLEARLPAWMVPKHWHFLDAFPLNASGKVDRNQLPGLSASPPPNPLAETELTRLQAIFAETLELQITDPDADLLSLGVHSIDMIRLGNRLQTVYGFAPGVGEMFQLRSLRLLAEYYHKAAPAKPLRPQASSSALLTGNTIPLEKTESAAEPWLTWKSQRSFSAENVNLKQLSLLLSVLEARPQAESLKYLYPSAGAVYPLRLYLHLHERCLPDLEAGLYRFENESLSLHKLSGPVPDLAQLHLPMSLEMAKAAKFSLYLVADLAKIESHYGQDARDYCLIETGCIAQLLRETAPLAQLGLCGIGRVDAELLKTCFGWNTGQELMHTLIGGIPAAETPPAPSEQEEWEEWSF